MPTPPRPRADDVRGARARLEEGRALVSSGIIPEAIIILDGEWVVVGTVAYDGSVMLARCKTLTDAMELYRTPIALPETGRIHGVGDLAGSNEPYLVGMNSEDTTTTRGAQ